MRPARSTVRLGVSLLVTLAVGSLAGVPQAQTPGTTEQAATTTPVGCVLTGTAQLDPDLMIFRAPTDDKAIARFPGGPTPLRVDEFPAAPGRARVVTATGGGGFRITGYVDAGKIPVFTQREVVVVPGHLWIGAQREVRVVAGTTARLEVEQSVTTPLRQTFKGWGPCDSFSLAGGTPPGWDVPGSAQGWKVKNDSVRLYDRSGTKPSRVATLSNAKGMLLWGTKEQDEFVWLQYHGEITVTAWARTSELNPLAAGEREDSLLPAARHRNPPRLRLAEVPKVVTTTRLVTIRSAPKVGAEVLGVIEPNTETYVLDEVGTTAVGWTSVLPKSLHVMPAGDGQFWVLTKELRDEPRPGK